MRRLLHIMAIILLVRGYAAAQVSVRETIRFKDTVEVPKYLPEDRGFSTLKLKMQPGEHHIQNAKDLSVLSGQTITGVDLVYSDYPEGEDFTELNRLRILELYMLLPQAFNSPIIEWRIVKQTGVTQTGGIQNYFHGFTVYYRPMPSFADEQITITNVIEGKSAPSDSTLLKVFNRNANWKDMLVVCDVTGSMSPYTAQLLFWIKSNQRLNTFKQIVFFNDDDDKSTDQTGREDLMGIWTIETGSSEKVIKTAFEAMQKGGHFENDLEAICYAIKKYPENKKNVVLIADNWETPCDMRLVEFLKQQKIPVRIVICGVTDRLNTAYLDLAYATGGSIHTMEDDLTEIAKIGEGKTFKLSGLRFKMSGGRFVQI
ncbi:MAG: vWA domain-containing protein [Bacteroidota bacterium]